MGLMKLNSRVWDFNSSLPIKKESRNSRERKRGERERKEEEDGVLREGGVIEVDLVFFFSALIKVTVVRDAFYFFLL